MRAACARACEPRRTSCIPETVALHPLAADTRAHPMRNPAPCDELNARGRPRGAILRPPVSGPPPAERLLARLFDRPVPDARCELRHATRRMHRRSQSCLARSPRRAPATRAERPNSPTRCRLPSAHNSRQVSARLANTSVGLPGRSTPVPALCRGSSLPHAFAVPFSLEEAGGHGSDDTNVCGGGWGAHAWPCPAASGRRQTCWRPPNRSASGMTPAAGPPRLGATAASDPPPMAMARSALVRTGNCDLPLHHGNDESPMRSKAACGLNASNESPASELCAICEANSRLT